jgi:predicted Rossmann fold flavoprotein
MAFEVAVVGAGAAGLAAGIFAARAGLGGQVIALDGARRPGAKILISGGGRCNVTNAVVTERDFWGGSRNLIRNVLRALPVEDTVELFREIGVRLHEEEDGKLFPDSNRAATVLAALLAEAERRGVRLQANARVTGLSRTAEGFALETAAGVVEARRVVLATGGLSIPKTGSDGAGYELARGLGHRLVPTTPALAPLLLEGEWHQPLSGVSHRVEIGVQASGEPRTPLAGSMLWTHFGASGPVVLNASRLWHRAVLQGRKVAVTANLASGRSSESVDQELLEGAAAGGRVALRAVVARWMPGSVADAVIESAGLAPGLLLSALTREGRRSLVQKVVAWILPVQDSRGYGFAEATAGGVELTEVDAKRLESRCCPGLFLAGEVLDVDGRIGGFNFQWAWSSGFVAGRGAAARS